MEPTPASTVVVARPAATGDAGVGDRGAGVEVLFLRRSPRSRFAPGFVVFPGGAIEPEDGDLAVRWFGEASEAPRACAVRELAEEAGVAVTGSGLREVGPGDRALDVVEVDPPRQDALHEIARWVAPEFLSVRFDAVFFAVESHAGVRVRPDGVEADRAWWARAGDVLAEHRLFETIMWPTYRTLQAIEECESVAQVLALSIPQEAPPLGAAGRSPEWRPAGSPPR